MKKVYMCLIVLISCLWITGVSAHELQLGESVGVMLHIEPDDVVRVGENTTIDFEITLKGGSKLKLQDCICTALIYVGEPSPRVKPVYIAPLKSTFGNPSLNFNFSTLGIYSIILDGKPLKAALFSPFKFKFQIQTQKP